MADETHAQSDGQARLAQAIQRIDAANAADPREEPDEANRPRPKELLYAERMSAELERFLPEASESLRLAARAQHLRRWEIPREEYPAGRAGYHKWRTTLYKFHADRAAEILREVGYDAETIERVQFLIQKKQLRQDPDSQALEDVICLVFLRWYFAPFAAKHPEEKVLDILRKTWKKMSAAGQAAALELPLEEASRALVERALAE